MTSAASTAAAEGGADDGETAMATAWGWRRELGGKGVDREHMELI